MADRKKWKDIVRQAKAHGGLMCQWKKKWLHAPDKESKFLIPLKAGLSCDVVWAQWERQESLPAIEPRFPSPPHLNLVIVTLAEFSWLPKGLIYKTGFI